MKTFKSVSEVENYAKRLLDVEYDIKIDGLMYHVNPMDVGYKFESVHIHGRKGRGHGNFWKHVASSIGCNAKRCYSSKDVNTPQYKYTLICDSCGKEQHARRMGSSQYSCGKCSPRKFNRDFLLRVIKNY